MNTNATTPPDATTNLGHGVSAASGLQNSSTPAAGSARPTGSASVLVSNAPAGDAPPIAANPTPNNAGAVNAAALGTAAATATNAGGPQFSMAAGGDRTMSVIANVPPPLFSTLSRHTILAQRRIIAEDPEWNLAPVEKLSELCIRAIVANFQTSPILKGLPRRYRDKILGSIATNLPLSITAPLVPDDTVVVSPTSSFVSSEKKGGLLYESNYWKRCALQRFHNCDPARHGGSWKRLFFELHTRQLIEGFVPRTDHAAEALKILDEPPNTSASGPGGGDAKQAEGAQKGQITGTPGGGADAVPGPTQTAATTSTTNTAASSSVPTTTPTGTNTRIPSGNSGKGLATLGRPHSVVIPNMLTGLYPKGSLEGISSSTSSAGTVADDSSNNGFQYPIPTDITSLIKELQIASPFVQSLHIRQLRPCEPPLVPTAIGNPGPESGGKVDDRNANEGKVMSVDPPPDHLDIRVVLRTLLNLKHLDLYYG
ncbi:T-complex-associated testis-expressed protein 1 [Quaeritorhiza haematococci]|nr:T-complex-associated testis-expressed protein 1 [Quaeritorhiza haematococci]